MATYKLIQDIEAEDHILGPLTLRQFIFALIAVFLFYLCFLSITRNFPFMLAVFVPPALFCAFFAIPFGMDQPTEVWALAKLRYLFKPRVRVWNQSGVKEMVTITAPKRLEALPAVKSYDQTEVKSRLRALADTIDSRGWAVKNVNPYMPQPVVTDPDRLLDIGSLPVSVPEIDIANTNDMLDDGANPLARQFDTMISASAREHRQQLMDQLNDVGAGPAAVSQPDSYWFMRSGAGGGTGPSVPAASLASSMDTPAQAGDDPTDNALARQLRARQASKGRPYEHLRTLQPIGNQPGQPAEPTASTPSMQSSSAMTPSTDPDILNLANNNDLNVTALAHEAERAKIKKQEPPSDEVVISLR